MHTGSTWWMHAGPQHFATMIAMAGWMYISKLICSISGRTRTDSPIIYFIITGMVHLLM